MTQVELLSYVFLTVSLVSSLLTIGVLKIQLRWTYGLYLLILYFVTMVTLIIAEFDVFNIAALNTDNY